MFVSLDSILKFFKFFELFEYIMKYGKNGSF